MSSRHCLLAALLLFSSSPTWALEPPWGKAQTLGEKRTLEKSALCTDGKGHYMAWSPALGNQSQRLFYGDGRSFEEVLLVPMLGDAFLEPRFFNKKANPSFRGLDVRVHSLFSVDREKKECSVTCGERTVPFTFVETEKAVEQLRGASFKPNSQRYMPYALLRDAKGIYYLVEQGRPPEEKSFRVHIGARGQLKPQQMTNIVSDSEGQIFYTKKGDLRLLLDRQKPSLWTERNKRVQLREVPVSENMPLIYNELGPYTGMRLGTPCDDQ